MANSSILSNNNIKTKGSFNIYPNPTTDILYFSGLEESVTIFNNLGQIVFYSSKMLKALDVDKFEKGIYFVRSGNKLLNSKAITYEEIHLIFNYTLFISCEKQAVRGTSAIEGRVIYFTTTYNTQNPNE